MSQIQKEPVDTQAIQQKLYHKFDGTDWQNKLKMFMLSGDFKSIIDQLANEVQEGRRFTPPMKDVFNAFIKCPFINLKLVIVGQDPYPKLGVADGIAFSCSNTDYTQPSLKMIHQALKDYMPDYEPFNDLTAWSEQGILMLNTALTTEIGKPGTHQKIWEPFMTKVFDVLSTSHPNLVYVFLGKKAQEWEDFVPDSAVKLYAPHPASAVYTGNKWNHDNIFPKATSAVSAEFDYVIEW